MPPIFKKTAVGLLLAASGAGLVCCFASLFPVAREARAMDRQAFSRPVSGMTPTQQMDFLLGRAMFKKLWISAPSSTKASDGLGPLYNARSCLSCHPRNGRGRPPARGKTASSLVLHLSTMPTLAQREKMRSGHSEAVPDPVYGYQLQTRAVQGHNAEGILEVDYKEFSVPLKGGEKVWLRKPDYTIRQAGYGPAKKNLQISPRIAPSMIGLGRLEAIPEQALRQQADPEDKNGDGISGRVSQVWSHKHQKVMAGRFGWKASQPTIAEQTGQALVMDMGLSNPLYRFPAGDCTAQQPSCRHAPNGNSKRDDNLEIGPPMFKKLAFYAASLAVPPPRGQSHANILRGKSLFKAAGCASCHRPSWKIPVASSSASEASAHKEIWAYSDLLLHDMGQGLADGRPVHNANGLEWRTPPLWGIGLTAHINGNTFYLHDGRARSIKEAILWHGGEARQARNRFIALDKQDRERLLAFVKSL